METALAGALAKTEGAMGVFAGLEGGRKRAVEDEARIRALADSKWHWQLASELSGEDEKSLDMASKVASPDTLGQR